MVISIVRFETIDCNISKKDGEKMKKINLRIISCVFSAIFIFEGIIPIRAKAAESASFKPNVEMSSIYTYDNMSADILALSQAFPDRIHYSIIGSTALGRNIYCVSLGNQSSVHHIMVQASIHAREYMCTQMCMKMIEYYAENKQNMLNKICFDIVPMSNPDGVSIAQSGIAAAPNSMPTQTFIKDIGHVSLWKTNAMGVDLNRNFDVGWEAINQGVTTPSYEKYKGESPCSEAETKALVMLALSRTYDAFISYHMQGGIVYYDEPGNTVENSAASRTLAKTIESATGYKIKNLKDSITTSGDVVQGGFNDWIQIALNRPGVTIEIGSMLPPGEQKNMVSIYNRNLESWEAVMNLYVK